MVIITVNAGDFKEQILNFLVLRILLLVNYCFVMWLLFSVFCDCTLVRNTKETTTILWNIQNL